MPREIKFYFFSLQLTPLIYPPTLGCHSVRWQATAGVDYLPDKCFLVRGGGGRIFPHTNFWQTCARTNVLGEMFVAASGAEPLNGPGATVDIGGSSPVAGGEIGAGGPVAGRGQRCQGREGGGSPPLLAQYSTADNHIPGSGVEGGVPKNPNSPKIKIVPNLLADALRGGGKSTMRGGGAGRV